VKLSSRRSPSPPQSAFAGFRFPPDVIVVAIRWYLGYNLSYRDVEELLLERGVEVDHVTIFRWVQRFTPLLADAARFCRHAPGDRWFVDETYVKVSGVWRYVYRAVDQYGQVIDVLVSARRDAAAARRFFCRALATLKVTPNEVVTDAAPMYPACWMSWSRRRGITSNAMPTTGSKPITASSNTGSERCADSMPTTPLRRSSPGTPSSRTSGAGTTNSGSTPHAGYASVQRSPSSPPQSEARPYRPNAAS
jgi:transposase-like protein